MSEQAASALSSQESGLWDEWLSQRSALARAELFFLYAEWSRIIASSVLSRYPHPLAEWQDYVQFASQGLLKAIDRFDPAVQGSFKAYAEPFLRGDILKGLSCYVRDGKGDAELVTSRTHSDWEGGDYYSLEEIVDVAVGLAFGHFLELGVTDASTAPGNPMEVYERSRELGALRDYVGRLPLRERQVIEGHYFQHLAFTEVANLLQVSRPRVTQLHNRALQRVREWYEADGAIPDGYA